MRLVMFEPWSRWVMIGVMIPMGIVSIIMFAWRYPFDGDVALSFLSIVPISLVICEPMARWIKQ